jgi:hypothetical protein
MIQPWVGSSWLRRGASWGGGANPWGMPGVSVRVGEAVQRALQNDVDLAILDISMPRKTGLQAAHELAFGVAGDVAVGACGHPERRGQQSCERGRCRDGERGQGERMASARIIVNLRASEHNVIGACGSVDAEADPKDCATHVRAATLQG